MKAYRATIKIEGLRMTRDRVLVKRDGAETETAAGIVIPDSVRQKVHTGRVLAAGPGFFSEETAVWIPNAVKTGDRVLLGDAKGHAIEVDGLGECSILRGIDVYGVIE